MNLSESAFALLEAHRTGKSKLTRKAGSFVGQCAVDPQPLTESQASWLATLLERAELPPVGETAGEGMRHAA